MAKLLKLKGKPRGRRLVIFGPPKTGKTALTAKLCKKFNLLWLDLESGVDTIIENQKELGLTDEDLNRIELISIPDTTANPIAIDTLMKMFTSSNAGYICDDHGVWNCAKCSAKKSEFFPIDMDKLTPANNWIIVIDSGSQLSSSALNRVINNSNVDPSTLSAKESKVSYTLWAGQGALLDKILSEIANRPIYTVMTAHEQETSADDKQKKLYPSIGTSNFAAKVSKYFSNVIHTKQLNGKFVIESANASARNADCGGHVNIDLSLPNKDITMYFGDPDGTAKVGTVTSKIGK